MDTQGRGPLALYKGSMRKALTDTFPELEFHFGGK